jgi:arylsulfatase
MTAARRFQTKVLLLALCAATVACDSNTSNVPQRPAPNVLLILADDLGFSDLGAYGSEIPTPNIDALAQSGALLTNFYANATCAPSRSMLLSGMDSHAVGFGFNPSAASRLPILRGEAGYSGNWPAHINSFVSQFSEAGYYTFMAGKWHQGAAEIATPYAHGFQKAFYLQDGGASHFADAAGQTYTAPVATYYDEGTQVSALAEDFYSSEFYVNKVMDYLDKRGCSPLFRISGIYRTTLATAGARCLARSLCRYLR